MVQVDGCLRIAVYLHRGATEGGGGGGRAGEATARGGTAVGEASGVHERLREHGVVDLVVAVLAVAHDVDDHVLLELLTILGSEATHARHGLDVVAVDMEDRSLQWRGRLWVKEEEAVGAVGSVVVGHGGGGAWTALATSVQ